MAIVGALVFQFRDMEALLQEHLDDFGELLPHVLMARITERSVARFISDPSDAGIRDLLEFLERLFESGSVEERELLGTSFLENLPGVGEDGAGILDVLGPSLQEHIIRFEL